jgi:RNA polymerase sigma-70 factor (ECF subfamily)
MSREVLVAEPPENRSTPPQTASDRSDDLMNMLGQLPESQREVILMLKVSGMSLEEVARATSSTVGAIKQKAHRAYAKLRESLAKEK